MINIRRSCRPNVGGNKIPRKNYEQQIDSVSVRKMPLRAPRKFSDSLISTLRGIVLVLDAKGRITLVNPYFEELTGYAASEVMGRDWFDTFIPASERDTIRKVFATALKKRIIDGYTNAIMTKSGKQLLIQWHSKTLNDSDGEIIGILCTGYDVTERVANASALEAAKEEAESATAAKSRFLAAASHDLRQPLQSLGFYLAALRRQLDDAEQQDIADRMHNSLAAMGELLNALLDISKFDGDSVVPERRDVNIKEILDIIVMNNVHYAEKKGLTLKTIGDECNVHTDPVLLARVIENFVSNAIHYTDRGQVTIDCRCQEGAARISVSDTGTGIPRESLDKIFDEYYQLDNPSRARRKGLGLGLAIVKQIARLLDHSIDVSSVPGEGSTFSVEVPLGDSAVAYAKDPVPTSASRNSGKPVVLFVDDDPAIVDATTRLLNSAGMRVHSAMNGDDALHLVAAGIRPDVLVSDYRLPGISGVELIRRMRRTTNEELRTVLMTGDTSASEIAKANVANCTVLHKPVDSDRLLSLLAGPETQKSDPGD